MAEAASYPSVNILDGHDLSDNWIKASVNNDSMDFQAAFLPVEGVTKTLSSPLSKLVSNNWDEICNSAKASSVRQQYNCPTI